MPYLCQGLKTPVPDGIGSVPCIPPILTMSLYWLAFRQVNTSPTEPYQAVLQTLLPALIGTVHIKF